MCKPRVIRTGPQRPPVYLFTDGSCDPDPESPFGIKAAYVAVMYDPEDKSTETFGQTMSQPLLRLLSAEGNKQQIVGQAELVPCHAAQILWTQRLQGRRIVLHIHNEAARFGLIKGTSPTRDSAWLINSFWAAEARHGSNTWIERVPSASNCADGPSRGRFDILETTRLAIHRRELSATYESDLTAQWKRRGADGQMTPASDWGVA